MQTQNIFITGATGKIGRFLVDDLRQSAHKIILLDNSGIARPDVGNIKYISGDILKPESYLVNLKDIDCVVHMAALTHTNRVENYYKVNSEATRELLSACKRYGVKKFVHISTRAISEDGGDYSRSKLLAERYVKESALGWVILRIAEVYGMSGGKGIDMMIENIDKLPFVPVIGDGRYKVCPVHIKDVIISIRRAIDNSGIENRTYTIAGPESYRYDELADIILKARRLNRPKVHIPLALMKCALGVLAYIFGDRFMAKDQLPRLISEKSDDISAARDFLSFAPKRIADLLVTGY